MMIYDDIDWTRWRTIDKLTCYTPTVPYLLQEMSKKLHLQSTKDQFTGLNQNGKISRSETSSNLSGTRPLLLIWCS